MKLNQYIRTILVIFILPLFLFFPSLASAQKPVGIVTALKGRAQLIRTGAQTALRFKDNVILRDIIDTQESSLVRVLFGGKSTVTVRELSRLEVREELLPGGGVRSVHNLSSGSILVNVARDHHLCTVQCGIGPKHFCPANRESHHNSPGPAAHNADSGQCCHDFWRCFCRGSSRTGSDCESRAE